MRRGGLGVRSKRCFITLRHFAKRCHANLTGSSFLITSVSPHPQPLSPKIRVDFDPSKKSFRPNFRGEGSEVGEGSEAGEGERNRRREREGLATANYYKPTYFATKLTIRSGTAISFKIVFPSNSSAIFGSAFASVNNSSLFVPRATTILDRNLPMI